MHATVPRIWNVLLFWEMKNTLPNVPVAGVLTALTENRTGPVIVPSACTEAALATTGNAARHANVAATAMRLRRMSYLHAFVRCFDADAKAASASRSSVLRCRPA